jgi:tRNA A-37 threonylcarbamoyl transferase component Bud32
MLFARQSAHDSMENLTGRQLGPYQILAPLGEGGMASVYRAYQPSMDREVAVKVLPRQYSQSPEYLARFKQEARLLARLQHPHVLPVFDFGESDGYTYIAMPLIAGGTLKDLMTSKPMPVERAAAIIGQVGDALDYAHASGLVHRDIKPSNILIDERGNSLLMDFGIARMVEATTRLTQVGGVVGTPIYMSPEQSAGKAIDARSDIYALGIVLFELLTGRVPYNAETPLAVMFKHVNDPLPLPRSLNPALSDALEKVLLKALAKQPGDRFQTMSEFVSALRHATLPDTASHLAAEVNKTRVLPDAVPVAARMTQTGTRAGQPLWMRVGAGVALLVVLAGIALGFRALIGGGESRPIATATVSTALDVSATPAAVTLLGASGDPTATQVVLPPADTATPTPAASDTPSPTETALAETATVVATAAIAPTEAPPVYGGASVMFFDRFDGTEIGDAWSVLNRKPVGVKTGLQLRSVDSAFPYVINAEPILPPSGDFQLRVGFRYSDLSACGTGILLTSYEPRVAASQDEAEAYQRASERDGFTAGVWQDATNGMSIWFRGAGQAIERPMMDGISDARPHMLTIQRSGDVYTLFLDGREIARGESTAPPRYVTFGHPASIQTCTGYWTSLTIGVVQVWRGTPTQAEVDATGLDQPAPRDACTPPWFFQPVPDGCLKSAKTRRAELRRYEQGWVLYLADLRRSFVFLNDGSWRDFNGTLDAAAQTSADALGAPLNLTRVWRACSGLAERGDDATAYISDPDGRVFAWTAQISTGQSRGWRVVDGAVARRCG